MLKKLFISHATEDKVAVAKPLADALIAAGFRVWYDEYSLSIGDSLKASIDDGLSRCDYAVVILSKSFFEKHWTREELDGLAILEATRRRKVVLPLWHEVSLKDVSEHSPTLAGKIAISTEKGIDYVVKAITGAVNRRSSSPFKQRDDMEERTIHVALAAAASPYDMDLMRIQGVTWEEFGEALLKEMRRLDEEDRVREQREKPAEPS
jgi:hypothetical protein